MTTRWFLLSTSEISSNNRYVAMTTRCVFCCYISIRWWWHIMSDFIPWIISVIFLWLSFPLHFNTQQHIMYARNGDNWISGNPLSPSSGWNIKSPISVFLYTLPHFEIKEHYRDLWILCIHFMELYFFNLFSFYVFLFICV